MNRWYYTDEKKKHGPITEEELKHRIHMGEVERDDYVWHEGMVDWKRAASVSGLLPDPPPLPSDNLVDGENDESIRGASERIEDARSRLSQVLNQEGETGDSTGIEKTFSEEAKFGYDASVEEESTGESEVSSPLTYANFSKRAFAFIIDYLLLFVVSVVMQALATEMWGMQTTIVGWGSVLALPYFVVFESTSYQGTFGKQAMNIQVTDTNGKRLSVLRATGRHFARIVSALPLMIGYLAPLFTQKNQAFHDMLASCLVVQRSGEGGSETLLADQPQRGAKSEANSTTDSTVASAGTTLFLIFAAIAAVMVCILVAFGVAFGLANG